MTPKRKNALNGKSPVMTYLVVLAAYAVLELCIKTGIMSSHLQGLLVPMVYYAIVAVGLNICVGILGELSLGHAGFMCIGAFGSAVFSLLTDGVLPDGLRFLLAFLIGVALATLFGFLIGIPVLRLNGDYLAIVTLAFGEIIKNLLNALYLGIDENGLHASLSNQMALGLSPDGKMLINGAMGVSGTPHDANFTISMVVLLIALFLAQNLVHSKHGRAIMAIRDNRIAAESIGINIVRYKMQAHLAGVLTVFWLQRLHHDSGVCGSRRHRQSARVRDCGLDSVSAAGAAPRSQQVPHADLLDRPDRRDDLQLGTGRDHVA